jgi:hypothetical protein
MVFVGIAATLILLAGGALIVPQIRRLWRHEPSKFDEQPAAWPWGSAAWRAYRRTLPALIVLLFPIMGAAVGLGIADGPHNALGLGSRALLAVATLVFFAVVPPIALLNRPGFLVPRHLRDEPGLLSETFKR